MKQSLKQLFYKFGYDIRARNTWHSHEVRRIKFLHDQNISLVLDVGANEGQYAQSLRQQGYKNWIISFEPIKDVFELLHQKSQADCKWKSINLALGDFDGYTDINISNLSQVSSILSATGIAGTEYWKATRKEQIQVSQLDSLINELNIHEHQVLLKIDTQGFESQVLRGGQICLRDNVAFIEIELSTRQLYSGEKLFCEMFSYIQDMGFELISMSPVYIDSASGYVLQYDCIFIRKNILDFEEK